MDTVEFLNEGTRMCNNYEACVGCPMEETDDCCMVNMNLKQMISIVEQWSKEHPIKTRQSELLKMFPDMKIDNADILYMCPMNFNPETYKDKDKCFCIHMLDDIHCAECRRDFWLKEIE